MLTVIAGYAANVTLYPGKLPFDPREGPGAGVARRHRAAHPDRERQPAREEREGADRLRQGESRQGSISAPPASALRRTSPPSSSSRPPASTWSTCRTRARRRRCSALMANDIQILVDVPSTLMPHVRGGKIKALGDVLRQAHPGRDRGADHRRGRRPAARVVDLGAVHGARRHAEEIVNRLAQETAKAINDSDIKDRFNQIGIEPVGNTPGARRRSSSTPKSPSGRRSSPPPA